MHYSVLLLSLLWLTFSGPQGEEKPGALVWSEEFNYTGLPDSTTWSYEIGNGCPKLCGWGNNEQQYYTARDPRNARVEDGHLIIQAIKDDQGRWTSARIKTQGRKSFTYGRMDIRAKVPAGAGTWPAIWMLSEDITTHGWPACGEIDIMEHVGKNPGQVHSALHSSSSFGATQNTGIVKIPDFNEAFHLYSAEWTPEKITFLVDEEPFYTYQPKTKNEATWPFHDDFFIIINIAIGGNWGSDPRFETKGLKNGVDPVLDSVRMEVDYVRVYEL